MHIHVGLVLGCLLLLAGCREFEKERETPPKKPSLPTTRPVERLQRLHLISLSDAHSEIPEAYKKSFPWLLKASDKMDEIFWEQAYGAYSQLFPPDQSEDLNKLIRLNYGPYDRLDDNAALLPGLEPKAVGANFYPQRMSERELVSLEEGLSKLTMIRRNEKGKLIARPYADFFQPAISEAADHLRMAAKFLKEGAFKEYLEARAIALETDQYLFSDGLWLGLWDETLDILIGPIESYEDALMGIKSAYQSCIVQKDRSATEEIQELVAVLPKLSLDLETEIRYERGQFPALESVGVYKALHFSGLFNAGSKSMGLNAPRFNYPREVEPRGKRRLILKNIVEAKYQYIAVPIGEALVMPQQQNLLNADAFFQYVLFHELSHGWELSPGSRMKDDKSIQEYLLEYASIMEEGKGDILGLHMITQAYKQNLMQKGNLESHFVTSLVNTLRAVRFGRTSDHARANMIRLNFFLEEGAYYFDEKLAKFGVNSEKMEEAIKKLAEKILNIQASGNATEALSLTRKYGKLELHHEKLLDTFTSIPVDLRFE